MATLLVSKSLLMAQDKASSVISPFIWLLTLEIFLEQSAMVHSWLAPFNWCPSWMIYVMSYSVRYRDWLLQIVKMQMIWTHKCSQMFLLVNLCTSLIFMDIVYIIRLLSVREEWCCFKLCWNPTSSWHGNLIRNHNVNVFHSKVLSPLESGWMMQVHLSEC